MGSKEIVVRILFMATVLLLVSSGVAETSNKVNTSKETIGNHGGEGGELSGYEGGEHGGYEHGGHEGGEHRGYEGRHRGERREHRGYYGHKRCHYGCCGKRYYKGGCRCCTFAGEKAEAEP